MNRPLIVDTGVLVAAFDRGDAWSGWVAETMKQIQGPLLTCESVLAETWFLLRNTPEAWDKVSGWIDRGWLQIAFSLSENWKTVDSLMKKYRDLPMSLADACLVVMIEQEIGSRVFTLDHHFRIFRHSGRKTVPVLMPEG